MKKISNIHHCCIKRCAYCLTYNIKYIYYANHSTLYLNKTNYWLLLDTINGETYYIIMYLLIFRTLYSFDNAKIVLLSNTMLIDSKLGLDGQSPWHYTFNIMQFV